MTKSTITRERLLEIIVTGPEASGAEQNELARMALAAMDSEPVAEVVSIYGDPEAFGEREIRPLVGIQQMPYGTKLYLHAQQPVVLEENHIGSKNALDAIVSFIKSKSNPTVKCYEEVSEQLFKDNCHGIHSHVIEYILKLGDELEDLRAEQAEMQPAPVVPNGYVMVPKEPTEEMLQASYREAAVYSPTAYRTMIAAAQQEVKP